MIQFKDYLDTLLEEKGIYEDHTFIIKSDNICGNHIVPIEIVKEFLYNLDPITQGKVRETLIKIDFRNGSIVQYLEFLTKGMIQLTEI
jgi:hypothetical protein